MHKLWSHLTLSPQHTERLLEQCFQAWIQDSVLQDQDSQSQDQDSHI